MCHRIIRYTPTSDIIGKFGIKSNYSSVKPSEGVSPYQYTPVIILENGEYTMYDMEWGMMPGIGNAVRSSSKKLTMIGLDKIRGTRSSYNNFCLIPVNGFFQVSDDSETPWIYVSSDKDDILLLAGIYNKLTNASFDFYSFHLLTVKYDYNITHLNNKMPLLIQSGCFDKWFGDVSEREALYDLNEKFPPNKLNFRAGSTPDYVDFSTDTVQSGALDENLTFINKQSSLEEYF